MRALNRLRVLEHGAQEQEARERVRVLLADVSAGKPQEERDGLGQRSGAEERARPDGHDPMERRQRMFPFSQPYRRRIANYLVQNIRFLRVSSEIFPFASHKAHGYTLEFCDDLLAKAGALANGYGHRLTTHPGQYTQLGSPKPEVVASAVKELEYHCEMLDRMGMGKDSVMIVHVCFFLNLILSVFFLFCLCVSDAQFFFAFFFST